MSVGITLYTVAEGEAYAPFAPRWLESVRHMDPMPDQVVIVIGKDDNAGIRDLVTDDIPWKIVTLDQPFSNAYFAAGVEAAETEWVGFSGIDDEMLPYAYRDIPRAGNAEIVVGTIILSNGHIWRGTWNPAALTRHNTLPAHSPFRKSLYEHVGGFPDIHWSDWGFWLKCAHYGARTFTGTEILAIFDIGADRETMSGQSLPDDKRQAADAELQAFMRSL